ncbi:MAG: AAA family ATPase, partial [Deltaproteobacteria bacterium]|nr:AAA family ATPase [Deltaproteobacteria bacterium]
VTGVDELRKLRDAEAQHEALTALLDELAGVAERFEGHVHQLDAERMTFVFGVPVAHEDDPIRAVHCALALRDAAAATGARLGVPLALKAGVDIGTLLVSGSRRGSSRLTGAVLLDAQRLEESSAPGLVLASAAVKKLTGTAVSFGAQESVVPRGNDEPLRAVSVEWLREAGSAGRSEATLAGRRRELEALSSALSRAEKGAVVAVLVTGEPGSGKSRLLEEAAVLAARAKMRVVCARADRAVDAELALVTRLLRSVCQALCAAHPTPCSEAQALASAGLAPQSVARLSAIVENKPRPSTADARLTEDADLAEAFAAAARQATLCLVADDLHLADSRSLAILADVLRRAEGAHGLALLGTSSSPAAATLGIPGLVPLALGPLSAEEVVQVAGQKIGGRLPGRAAALIRDRAMGNPFYARQLAQLLVDTGSIQLLGDGWQVSPAIEQFAVPASLQLAVEAQLDRAGGPCITLLRVAAVAGQSFSEDLLRQTLGSDFPLQAAVAEALERGLLLPVEGAAQTLRFAQAVVRDALLAKALRADLKQLHLRLAQAIEAGAPAPEGDREPALADHYLAADVADRAIYWAARAATELQERGLLAAAATYHKMALQTGLPLLGRPPVTERNAAWLLRQLALALPCLTRVCQSDALALAEAVLDKVPTGSATAERAEALRQKALLLIQASRIAEAERALDEALRLVRHSRDPEALATVLGDQGAALEARGDLEGAAEKLTESFQTVGARPTRNQDFYWEHLNRLGRVYARLQNMVKAKEFFNLARDQARRVASLVGETKTVINLAGVVAAEGSPTDALALLDRALELALRSGDRVEQARIHYNAGRLLLTARRNGEARERLQLAAEAAREVGWREGLALAGQALDTFRAA